MVGTVAAVEMTGRGIESLTRMDDREVYDKASKTKHGDKFLALFNGEKVLATEEQNERSLMARLAMHTGENTEQLLRIFRASGQFREAKPNAYYEKMAKEKTIGDFLLKRVDLEFTDEIVDLISLIEILDAGYSMKGADVLSYKRTVELLALTYSDKNFTKVNDAIRYKYSTIEKLSELLSRLDIVNTCLEIYRVL